MLAARAFARPTPQRFSCFSSPPIASPVRSRLGGEMPRVAPVRLRTRLGPGRRWQRLHGHSRRDLRLAGGRHRTRRGGTDANPQPTPTPSPMPTYIPMPTPSPSQPAAQCQPPANATPQPSVLESANQSRPPTLPRKAERSDPCCGSCGADWDAWHSWRRCDRVCARRPTSGVCGVIPLRFQPCLCPSHRTSSLPSHISHLSCAARPERTRMGGTGSRGRRRCPRDLT